MKKLIIALLAVMVLVTFTAPEVDARRGGFKSGRGSFKSAPAKSQDSGTVNKDAGTTKTSPNSNAGTTANRGFFSGGSLMKGLMIGGLAGLLFGGFFGPLGAFGELLGLMINLLAIYILFAIGRNLYRAYQERKKIENKRY